MDSKNTNMPLSLFLDSDFEVGATSPVPAKYVDKTPLIADLIKRHRFCSLSRPRRFGKSTTLYVIKDIFTNGLINLENYAIKKDNLLPDLKTCPVLFFDFLGFDFDSQDDFLIKLYAMFKRVAFDNKIKFVATTNSFKLDPVTAFEEIFSKLSSQQVVVLIDEYDLPLINSMKDPVLYEKVSMVLQSFYGVLKSYQTQIRFMMITGVNRLSNISIFSGFNNIKDISFLTRYASIVGYTEQELLDNFADPLRQIAKFYGMDMDSFMFHLKSHYNGYCFDQNRSVQVFNTWDINQLLVSELNNSSLAKMFPPFWIETGAISNFVLRYFQHNSLNFTALLNEIFSPAKISLHELTRKVSFLETKLQAFLFNAGYLTLADISQNDFILDFPNSNVKNYVLNDLVSDLKSFDPVLKKKVDSFKQDMLRVFELETSNEERCSILSATIASCGAIANDCFSKESQLRTLLVALIRSCDLNIQFEIPIVKGRIDLLVSTITASFIIELKVINSLGLSMQKAEEASKIKLEEALRQIKNKNYALALPHSFNKYFIALVADCNTGTITDCVLKTEDELKVL